MSAEVVALALIKAVLDIVGFELAHQKMTEEEVRRAQKYASDLADAKFKEDKDG